MKTLIKIIYSSVFIFTFTLTASSQITAPPFDSTWYGFNTSDNQRYFLSRAMLIDIDNDNDSDVIGSKYFAGFSGSASGFVVLKNNGTGFYNSAPVHYSSPQTSGYVEAADLNNDGYQDVIVSNSGANHQGNSISIFLNQGNGNFAMTSTIVLGEGPNGIAAADFNNDNKVDLAVALYGFLGTGSSVSVLLGTGNGSFSNPVSYPAGNSPYKLSAGKINQDSFTDLVIANENGDVNVLLNSGTGDFSARSTYNFPLSGTNLWPSVFLTDIDNDLDLDILYNNNALSYNGIPAVGLLRNQAGSFSIPEYIPLTVFGSGITDVEAADLNQDGWKDIVGTSTSARTPDGYQVALSNGSGGFLPAYKNPGGQNTVDVMLGDSDSDGLIDLYTADSYSNMITVHKNNGSGIFPVPRTFSTGNSIAGSTDAADIDGDGDLDIVTSASGRAATGVTVKVLKNLGSGQFSNGITYSIRGGGVQAKFRDLNGDDKPDLLFATAINSPPYDFHFGINNGDGTFGAIQTKSIGSCGWYDIDAADLDNDGDNDVLISEWLGCPNIPESAKRIFICLNDGNANFSDPLIEIMGPSPAPVGIGDFNNDGKKDLAAGVSGAMIEVSLGLGNGDFNPPVEYSIGDQGGATDIVIADFNRDGNSDIASCNFWESTTMSVLYGNGDGTFGQALILPSAYSPDLLNVSGIAAGDLDNDGDKDIMVSNNASNSISLYYNVNGTFEYTMRVGAYSGASAPFFGDFDNDNKGDIVAVGGIPPSGIGSNLIFIKGKNTGTSAVTNNYSYVNAPDFLLKQNYPNPFNPSTKITFETPYSSFIKLTVFDVTGREMNVLINEQLPQGNHEIQFNAGNLSSGVYFYKLESNSAKGHFSRTMKMVLVR